MGSGAGVPGPLVTLAPMPCDAQQSVCIALDFRLPSELGCKSVFLNGGPEEFTHLLFDLSHSLLHSGRKSYICAFIVPGPALLEQPGVVQHGWISAHSLLSGENVKLCGTLLLGLPGAQPPQSGQSQGKSRHSKEAPRQWDGEVCLESPVLWASNFFLWYGDPPWHAPSDTVKLKEKTSVKSQERHPQSRCQGQLVLALHADLNCHLL